MSQVATTTETITRDVNTINLRGPSPPGAESGPARNRLPGPMKYRGSLDKYPHFESTPSIGREYSPEFQLSSLLTEETPETDDVLQDIAILISRRGVCFFRDQNITSDQMMRLAERLSDLSGSPKESGHVRHPVGSSAAELPKVGVISAEKQKKGGGINRRYEDISRWASVAWHSDVSFERVPADYSMLKIVTLPPSGGDTLWVNCYDVIERMSPSFREYLETLTCEHNAHFFHEEARRLGVKINTGPRSNPLNIDDSLEAHHPCIRTNPVTGWKALFVNGGFSKRIDDVTKDESDMIMEYIKKICTQCHDCQVRLRWTPNTVAVWDNRSTWHSATFDYEEERVGHRASTIGEQPYLDPKSKLRSEGLKEDGLVY